MAVDWKGIDLQGPDGVIVAVDIARTVEDTAFLARDIAKIDEAGREQPVLDEREARHGGRAEAVVLVGQVESEISFRRGGGPHRGIALTRRSEGHITGDRF